MHNNYIKIHTDIFNRIVYLGKGEWKGIVYEGWYFIDESEDPVGPFKDAWRACYALGVYTQTLNK